MPLELSWDKVCLAHPDSMAPQRTAHALALLGQIQNKRDAVAQYQGLAEASPGVER